MALFWFDKLAHVVPNHLTGAEPESVVAPDEVQQVRGRSMLVKRLKPLPIEAVVRGYLAGSGWKEYQQRGRYAASRCPLACGRRPDCASRSSRQRRRQKLERTTRTSRSRKRKS